MASQPDDPSIKPLDPAAAQAKEAEANAQTAMKARVQLLRSQLDPDFLFNTLNSLSSLIQARRHEDADHLIASLAHYLRAPSGVDEPPFVSLQREFGTARAFLEIHALRMDKMWTLNVTFAPELSSVQMPCLILLPMAKAAALAAWKAAPACEAISLSAGAAGTEILIELSQRFDRPTDVGVAAFRDGMFPLSNRLTLLYGSTDRLEFDLGSDSVQVRLRLPAE